VIGLAWDRPRDDLLRGIVLFAVVGLAGLGIYLAGGWRSASIAS
jgi:hypothetical protein